jgi:hypothetical protein
VAPAVARRRAAARSARVPFIPPDACAAAPAAACGATSKTSLVRAHHAASTFSSTGGRSPSAAPSTALSCQRC